MPVSVARRARTSALPARSSRQAAAMSLTPYATVGLCCANAPASSLTSVEVDQVFSQGSYSVPYTSVLDPRLSWKVTYALPSARTASATDSGRAAASVTIVLAVHVPLPAASWLMRILDGVVRSSSQTTISVPAPSMPMRGERCAAVPGSSLILAFALQAPPPEARLAK